MTRTAIAPFPRTLPGNPYCDLLYGELASLGVEIDPEAELSAAWLWRNRARVAVLHLHWPEAHYRLRSGVTPRSLLAFVADVLLAVCLGYRLVWTVHNATPHEGHVVDRFVRRLLLACAHPVVHCAEARTAVRGARFAPVVIPHGHYIGWYPDTIGRDEARRRLGLGNDEKVLLCFGQVRGYKGIDDLLRAFAALDDPRLRLVVAGRPVSARDATRVRTLAERADDPRIRLELRYVADEEVEVFFKAADLVVLPYRAILTSGAAMLALSFGRALIVPRLGCLAGLAGRGCAIDYDADQAGGLAEALALAARVDPTLLGQRGRATAEALGWERIARAYARVYGLTTTPAGTATETTTASPRTSARASA